MEDVPRAMSDAICEAARVAATPFCLDSLHGGASAKGEGISAFSFRQIYERAAGAPECLIGGLSEQAPRRLVR